MRPSFNFDTTTQFIWQGEAIALCQGEQPIVKGYVADWLSLFQNFDKPNGNESEVKISETFAGAWDAVQHTVVVYDPSGDLPSLHIAHAKLRQLEDGLLEIFQGCCGPVMNLVADIIQEPDEILGLLQDTIGFRLSAPQIQTAKSTISGLPTEFEIEILDLYNIWADDSELSHFARALRFYFLAE